MTLRIKVDMDLCQGHGVCESEAPDVFEVDRDHKVRVLNESPAEAQLKAVNMAVKYCPTHALKLVDEDSAAAVEADV